MEPGYSTNSKIMDCMALEMPAPTYIRYEFCKSCGHSDLPYPECSIHYLDDLRHYNEFKRNHPNGDTDYEGPDWIHNNIPYPYDWVKV